jgi:hypothetical protein
MTSDREVSSQCAALVPVVKCGLLAARPIIEKEYEGIYIYNPSYEYNQLS